MHRAALEQTARLHPEELDFEERTALLMVAALARVELAALEQHFERFAVLSHMGGPGTLLATLGSLQRADTAERLEHYVARLNAVPEYLSSAATVATEAARSGQVPARAVIDRTIAQVERLLAGAVSENPALSAVPADDGTARSKVAATIERVVLPAYGRFRDVVLDVRPHAPEALGLCALAGGDELYRARIFAWTSLDLDPSEVHSFGCEDVAAIEVERAELGAGIERREGEPKSRAEILALANGLVERGWEACHEHFGRLPKENCEVRAVDPSRERDVLDYYIPPTADGSRPGVYYVNTGPGRDVRHLASTVFHEANPGHHLQMSLEQEAADRPAIRRFGNELVAGAFVEGWALYGERLADEIGLFTNDYDRLGMLELQALRAVRLVVDTGIHAFGWDRERALREMRKTGLTENEIAIEVDRYAGLPAQALSYRIGQRSIERLRKRAQARDGTAFSLKAFHDRLLALGSLPLDTLETEVERSS